jgi:MFS family permease
VAWPRGGLWRHPDFLRLWGAQTISQFGTQVSALALPLAAILVLGASAFQVALLGTVEFLPFLLFTLPAGVWIDRSRRQPILIAADLGRAVLLVSVPIAYAADALTVWQLYAVGFLVGTLTVCFDVAYQSYLPSLVRRDQLVDGNSKLELSQSAAQLGGPAAAGGLIAAFTAPWAVLADSVSFVGSALFVLGIRTREELPAPAPDAPKPKMMPELKQGLRFVFGDARLRALTEATAIFNFFTSMMFAVYLVYAVRSLGLSAGVIGVIFSVANVGSVLGVLVAGRLTERVGIGHAIVASGLLSGAALLLVPLAPADYAIPFLVTSGILTGLGVYIWRIAQVSLRQAITPDRMLGRVNSVSRFVMWGTLPLGSLLGGALGSTIGLRETMWIGAAGAAFCVVPVLLSPVRTLERLPEAPEPEPEAALAEPTFAFKPLGVDESGA